MFLLLAVVDQPQLMVNCLDQKEADDKISCWAFTTWTAQNLAARQIKKPNLEIFSQILFAKGTFQMCLEDSSEQS